MKNIFYLFCSICFFLTSCARYSYFTRNNKASLETAGNTVKNVQFYNDRRIQLRRIVSSEDAKLLSGKIRLINGVYVNILYLRKFTPGVCDEYDGNKLSIKFENGNGKLMTFQADQKDVFSYFKVGPSKRPDLAKERELYSIAGENWTHIRNNKYTGTIKYDNLDYTIRFRTHHRTRFEAAGPPYMPTLVVRRNRNLYLHIIRRRIKGKRL